MSGGVMSLSFSVPSACQVSNDMSQVFPPTEYVTCQTPTKLSPPPPCGVDRANATGDACRGSDPTACFHGQAKALLPNTRHDTAVRASVRTAPTWKRIIKVLLERGPRAPKR